MTTSGAVIRSQLEEMLDLEQLEADTYKTNGPLWHPPGGRSLYGGTVVAQSLAAAQLTVDADFACHSLQSQFLLPASADLPITYSVERLRGGRSYATRSVRAIQEGKRIYAALLSFSRKLSGRGEQVRHALTPAEARAPGGERTRNVGEEPAAGLAPEVLPISLGGTGIPPQSRVLRCWIRAPEAVSRVGDMATHQAILAYLSDWFAISAVSYIHGHFKFPESITRSITTSPLPGTNIGMLSTLNHAVHFHSSPSIRADEWMLLEASSPWAGDERCVANGRVFSQDGTLLATYTQEGVYRLKQDGTRRSSNL